MRLEPRKPYSPPLCEICHEPIEDRHCIVIPGAPHEERCMHSLCMSKILYPAFSGIIGTQDDDIAEMITDTIIDALTVSTPLESDYLE